jgi:hypothetical protein
MKFEKWNETKAGHISWMHQTFQPYNLILELCKLLKIKPLINLAVVRSPILYNN